MDRQIVWKEDEGWTCSQCLWTYPIVVALTLPAVRSAYDNLALAWYAKHDCSHHPLTAQRPPRDGNFLGKMRMLVMRGLKPTEAVERILKEAAIDYRDDSKTLEKARAEGDEFLRRIREGHL